MKADYPFVFGQRPYSKDLDYIALWFVKGADYIEGTRAELAFVTTNSVSQGEHVGLMFPMIFAKGLEIGFAYTSFKWENNAKRNAGVTVAVINLRAAAPGPKYIFTDGLQIEARTSMATWPMRRRCSSSTHGRSRAHPSRDGAWLDAKGRRAPDPERERSANLSLEVDPEADKFIKALRRIDGVHQ